MVTTTHTAAILAAIDNNAQYTYIAYKPVLLHQSLDCTTYPGGSSAWCAEYKRLRDAFHNRPR